MAARIRLIGVIPKKKLCDPDNEGWYLLESVVGSTIAAVLRLFGLEKSSMLLFQNGNRAVPDDLVNDGEEVRILTKVSGG